MTARKKKQETAAASPVDQASATEEGPPVEGMPAPDAPAAAEELPARPVASRMVAFHLGTQSYGFEIDAVQEIQQIVALAQVPDDDDAVLGLVNLRGEIVPVVDLRTMLGMEQAEMSLETPMVICRSSQGLVAFVVDAVDDVVEIPPDCLQPPPQLHSLAGRMLAVCRLESGMVFLLDIEKLVERVDLEAVKEGSA